MPRDANRESNALSGGLVASSWRQRLMCLLFFGVHGVAAYRLVWQRLQDPMWWPLLAGWLLLPLFYLRSAGALVRLSWVGRGLLLLDFVMLLYAEVRGSVWLVWAALAVFVTALLHGHLNRAGDRTVVRMSLLSWLSVGLPPFLAQRLWTESTVWLAQACSVLGAGWGWQTVLSGSSVLGVNGRFSLEEMCGTGLCWTWVVSAGLWWALLQRRSVLQSVLLVVCACGVTVVGVLAGGLWGVWQLSGGATSPGVVQVNAVLFLPQLLLVLSADSLLLFLTSPVLRSELMETRNETGVFEQEQPNPLEVFWNRFVAAERRSFGQRVQFRLTDGTPLPWLRLVRMACETWLSTRSLGFLLLGAPAAILLVLAGTGLSRLAVEQAKLSVRVETQLQESLAGGSLEAAERLLQMLDGYGASSPSLRFRFAEALWQRGERERAWGEMEELSELGVHGLAEAHLWLVEQAQQSDPWRKLSLQQQQSHLEMALRTEIGNADVYGRLAEVLLRLGEGVLAERQLQRAAELNPVYVNALFRLRRQRGQLQLPDAMLTRRIRQLQVQLAGGGGAKADALQLAELYLFAQQPMEADAVLRGALQRFPDDDLRRALGDLLSSRAIAQLDSRDFDGGVARREVEESIGLWPAGAGGVRAAGRLLLSGVICRSEVRERLRGSWLSDDAGVSGEQNSAADMQILSAIVRLLVWESGDVPLTLEGLPLTADGPLLLGLLRLRGSVEQTAALADQFLRQLPLVGDRADVALLRWRVMLAAGRYAELQSEVSALRGRGVAVADEAANLLGRSWLAEFDETAERPRLGVQRMMKWLPVEPSAELAAQQLDRLRQAVAVPGVRTLAIDRLCRVVLSGGEWSQQAERVLTDLRSSGVGADYLYGRLGDLAAALGHYERAVQWQRLALAAAKERSYSRMNNLAICLLRSQGSGVADECLQLVEEALQLVGEHPQLLATRGEILLRRGQHVRARGDLEASLRLAPGSAEVWGLLAEACELGGDAAMAQRARAEQAERQKPGAEVE